jgi:hypothetical protein
MQPALTIGGSGAVQAAGVLCGVIAATANARVLLVEVVRDERYEPVDDPVGADVAGAESRRTA